MKRLLFIILSLLLICPAAADARRRAKSEKPRQSQTTQARTSASVKEEKEKNEQLIQRTRQQIAENRKRTSRQLNALNSLNGEILQQTSDIEQLAASIASLDSLAEGITDTIAIIESDVKLLRENYARSLRRQRDARQGLSTAALIFSSESFYQAVKRLEYIKQLEKWRNDKTERLRTSVELLNLKRQGLTDLRKKHAIAVNRLNTGRRQLQEKKKRTEVLVASLKKEGAGLEAELNERRRRARALDAELDRIIAEELRRAEAERIAAEKAEAERIAAEKAKREKAEREKAQREKEERRKAEEQKNKPGKTRPDNTAPEKTRPEKTPDLTKPSPEANAVSRPSAKELEFKEKADAVRRLTGSFESNKGRLLFPVEGKYNVVGTFGRSRHTNLSKVEIENSGIDIETTPGAGARAVYDGVVSSIFYMEGYHNIVMVRHGEYLTVYTNLDNLNVKKGDKVKTGQKLGRIYTDPDDENGTVLHFEVRKERTKLNPLNWVK